MIGFIEFSKKYLTEENIEAYRVNPDKLVFVSDLTGLSVDDRFVNRLDMMFTNTLTEAEDNARKAKKMEITSIKVNDKFYTPSFVHITILSIEVASIHLTNPEVLVTYEYNDGARRGRETVGIKNFCNNIRD